MPIGSEVKTRPFADQALEAWIQNQKLPQIFEGTNWGDVLRADKLGDEFGVTIYHQRRRR